MAQADKAILLEIPLFIRKKRIFSRWIKQNLCLERCIYKPRLGMLKAMFQWAKSYSIEEDGTKGRVAQYQDKTVTLHNNREIRAFLESLASLRP